jgi:tRNA threonylcarbamoyl adenosine modification protein YeaZ
MKLLGIDTSSKFLCLGLYDTDKAYEYRVEAGTRLSSVLGLTIERALSAVSWRLSDIDYLACGLGPGSFTGLRIGISAIKGLSWSLNRPIVGISTMECMAAAVEATDVLIITAIDAKRNLIYCAGFRKKRTKLTQVNPHMLLSTDEFFKKIKGRPLILGDAAHLLKNELARRLPGARILDTDFWYPKPEELIKLALEKIRKKKFIPASRLDPIYLYPRECQVRKK